MPALKDVIVIMLTAPIPINSTLVKSSSKEYEETYFHRAKSIMKIDEKNGVFLFLHSAKNDKPDFYIQFESIALLEDEMSKKTEGVCERRERYKTLSQLFRCNSVLTLAKTKQAPFYLLIVLFSFTLGNKKVMRKKRNNHSTSETEQHYQLFSTFTSYDTVRSNILKQPECVPEALWAFMRHGTRYPHIENMERYRILETLRDYILSNHCNGEGKLNKFQIKLLRDWRFTISNEEEMHLTPSGHEELVNLGKRLKKTFPCLLDKKRFSSIHMKRTSADRTLESAAALTEGIFGQPILLSNSTIDEILLKNGKQCSSYMSSINSDDSKNKIEKFKHSLEVQRLIDDVSARLGFGYNLTFDTIADMYDVCGYETAWYHGEYSTWCSAFSTEELQILEYLDDLSYYWKTGYGNPFTTKLGCELVRDMITKLNSSNDTQKTTLYFAHSVGVRQLLTSLGIGKCGNPLSGDVYTSSTDRNCWRTSHLSPFSANIISVLYSCKTSHEKKSKIGVYINEKIVEFPFCNGTLCDFEAFKNRFSSLIDQTNCNRDFCFSSPTDTHQTLV